MKLRQFSVVCVADFGLGRLQASPLATEMSTGVGTPAYMAPEMFNGKISAKVDIYALGIILNECLTRTRPFSDYENPSHIIFAVGVRGERPRLAADEAVPPVVLDLVTRCWDSDPRRRPTAAEIEKALDRMLVMPFETSLSVEGTAPVRMSTSSDETWSSMGGPPGGKRTAQAAAELCAAAAAGSAEPYDFPDFDEVFDCFRSMESCRCSASLSTEQLPTHLVGSSEASSSSRRASVSSSSCVPQSLPSSELQHHPQDATAHHAAINIDGSNQAHQP